MKKEALRKTRLEFREAKITVGQVQIVSTGIPHETIVRLDGVERNDIVRVEITIDARLPMATVNLYLVPGLAKREAA